MKNIFFLVVLLLCLTAKSQTLTEKEITGTWMVVAIAEPGTKPDAAPLMKAAYFDLYQDHNFQIRLKRRNPSSHTYDPSFHNARWQYDPEAQLVRINNGAQTIKVSHKNEKVYFELTDTGLIMEMKKPE